MSSADNVFFKALDVIMSEVRFETRFRVDVMLKIPNIFLIFQFLKSSMKLVRSPRPVWQNSEVRKSLNQL